MLFSAICKYYMVFPDLSLFITLFGYTIQLKLHTYISIYHHLLTAKDVKIFMYTLSH
jgi:hypothetical protein